ncbi:MAG: hypothetical protein KKA81_00400 [Bacteroidetes bacterium]|nr:hypothetical protein [Bacteroidota bacterium]
MHRRFYIRALTFILVLIAANILLDQVYKNFVVHNILNNAKDKDFLEYDDTLTYLSMGNSHNTVNTYILENSYNYFSPAENYVQTYYKLKYILENTEKKPENLLLYIDLSSFGPRAANYFEHNSYWVKYLDFFELARIKDDRDVLANWVEGRFFSYAGNYRDFKLSLVYLVKIGKLELHHGYRPPRNFKNFAYNKPEGVGILSDESTYDWSDAIPVDSTERMHRARQKSSIYFAKDAYFDSSVAIYFEMILEKCRQHDVNVILLRAPVTKEYFQDVSQMIPVELIYDSIKKIYSKYPNVIQVLDYHDLYFDHPEYFFDADHLNPVGAEEFTKRLRCDLEKQY